MFLNDLQAGPSSCGCGNDQCRWALDYGSPRDGGEDARRRRRGEDRRRARRTPPGQGRRPGLGDRMRAGGPARRQAGNRALRQRRLRQRRLLAALRPPVEPARSRRPTGPIALGLWSETFRRDPARWIETDLALFQNAPARRHPAAPGERPSPSSRPGRQPGAGCDGLRRPGEVAPRGGSWLSTRSTSRGSLASCPSRDEHDATVAAIAGIVVGRGTLPVHRRSFTNVHINTASRGPWFRARSTTTMPRPFSSRRCSRP